jgi:hypothetical protein
MWMDVDGCGWMWMDVDGCGWMWMDVMDVWWALMAARCVLQASNSLVHSHYTLTTVSG